MIPPFNEHGWLPDGIHDCTLDEAAARFGTFQNTDRRPLLWTRFAEFIAEAKACGLLETVLMDGSFVTATPAPNDIDIVIVVSANHDFEVDFTPSEYNVLSKRRVNVRFGLDLLVARANSEEYRRYVAFFQQVPLEPGRKKGILRLTL
jgi:hypothetical protein